MEGPDGWTGWMDRMDGRIVNAFVVVVDVVIRCYSGSFLFIPVIQFSVCLSLCILIPCTFSLAVYVCAQQHLCKHTIKCNR